MRTTRYIRIPIVTFLFSAISLVAVAQNPLQFVPVTPCRLVDTRPDRGGQGPIQGGTSRTFNLPQLAQTANPPCASLAAAAAYSLNVAVVPEGYLGYLTIWPTGQMKPVVATLNSTDGRIKANAAIVVAGDNQSIDIYVTNTTNVVLDIDGYFEPAVESALAFYPMTPCRIADTRPDRGGSGPIQGGTSRDFPVLGISGCQVPDTAQAYSLNFAAVPPGPLGYLTVWPTGGTRPVVSTLNDLTGTIVANAALVPAGTDGEISVYPQNDTNLVIDINGYFAPPGPGGLALYPVTPCRVIDTRKIGSGDPFSGTLDPPIDVGGSPCLQSQLAAQAYVLNASVVPVGPLGYLTLWPDGVQQPLASTLNALDGFITNNMAIVPSNNGKIDAYASGTTQLILDISSYFAPLPTLTITTTSLPTGTVSMPYSSTLMATGGVPPYSWSVTSGMLPPGLGLSSDGVISGTPTGSGTFSFTVQVTDTEMDSTSTTLSIIVAASSLMITTTELPAGTVQVPYTASLGASGGLPPYTWSVISGTLPIGLSLSTDGTISGTPTVAGSSNFTVQVTDSELPPVMATALLSITINAATTNAALKGNYTFSFNGFNNGSPMFMAGSFIADGDGNLTSGVLDMNSASGAPQQQVALTGTYSIQANGLGTMTFQTAPGNFVFSVSVSNKGLTSTSRNGNMILRDPDNPQSYGSGVIIVQNTLDFSLPRLQGNYAVGYFGVDPSLGRIAGAGAYKMDVNGNLSNGTGDVNDNGVAGSTSFTGSFSAPDTTTGRGTATVVINGTTTHYAFYIASAAQLILMSTDAIQSPANLTLWSVLEQTSSAFSEASLVGTSVVDSNGIDVSGASPVPEAFAGLFTADGHGGGSISIDENDGGTLNQLHASGIYSVATNGRVTLSSSFGDNPPIIYLVDRNQGFLVGTDALAGSGTLNAQFGSVFTNLSILGTYLGGTITPVLPSVTNAASWVFSDGNGNMNFSINTSGPGGPGSMEFAATYQVDGTGRGVLMQGQSPIAIVYVLSPQRVIVLPDDATPALSSFTLGATN